MKRSVSPPRPDDVTSDPLAGSEIPVALTSLIGRTRELEGVNEALHRSRLVTVTGPGGVGKTRLALEVARRQVGRRLGGVWFVDLAAGHETPEVATETARVLGLGTKGDAIDGLRRYLAERDVLLVLDNCEHVVDECAELAAVLLGSCPQVRVLATSREPLEVNGETVWRLDPLDGEDARRLFLQRARQRRSEFLPDEEGDVIVRTLCERLDRLPLAIELAAARTTPCPRRKSSPASRITSASWALCAGSPRSVTAACMRPWNGATSSSIPPNRWRYGISRCSSVAFTPKPRRRRSPGCRSTSLRDSSTSRSSAS
jgi:hypothetical protein